MQDDHVIFVSACHDAVAFIYGLSDLDAFQALLAAAIVEINLASASLPLRLMQGGVTFDCTGAAL